MSSESPEMGGTEPGTASDAAPSHATTYPGRSTPRQPGPEEPILAPETDLWKGRTDWKHYAGRFLLLAVIVLAGSWIVIMGAQRSESLTPTLAAGGIFLLVIVGGAIFAGPVLWTILSHRYRVTTQRLIIERGILSQTIDQTELVRVDDVRIHKSLTDRILGLGSVGVISTDATDREVLIPGVKAPEQLADTIRARMRVARQRAVYVEQV